MSRSEKLEKDAEFIAKVFLSRFQWIFLACFVDEWAKEFEDMERFLEVGEEILFEYPLKNYYVVILPPSFPYGGMENPVSICLSH